MIVEEEVPDATVYDPTTTVIDDTDSQVTYVDDGLPGTVADATISPATVYTDPATGLPIASTAAVDPATGLQIVSTAAAVDPATGLPIVSTAAALDPATALPIATLA